MLIYTGYPISPPLNPLGTSNTGAIGDHSSPLRRGFQRIEEEFFLGQARTENRFRPGYLEARGRGHR